jgi:hypothetical protein
MKSMETKTEDISELMEEKNIHSNNQGLIEQIFRIESDVRFKITEYDNSTELMLSILTSYFDIKSLQSPIGFSTEQANQLNNYAQISLNIVLDLYFKNDIEWKDSKDLIKVFKKKPLDSTEKIEYITSLYKLIKLDNQIKQDYNTKSTIFPELLTDINKLRKIQPIKFKSEFNDLITEYNSKITQYKCQMNKYCCRNN